MKRIFMTACLAGSSLLAMAQNSNNKNNNKVNQGLSDATTQVKDIFETATNLLYAVCAIMAILGAFHVYSKWTSGDPDVTKAAAGWIGGLIFVGVAITIIRAVFL